MDQKDVYEFKKKVRFLEEIKGRGTELISVYITPKYPVSEIISKLRDEFGQASNIKSASTRKNVQGALEKIIQFLKGVRETPEKGLAVFCGNVSRVEGKEDIQLYFIEPLYTLQTQFYRCEERFILEPLKEMIAPLESYGLVVLDGKEATVALLNGKEVKVIKKLDTTAPQKVTKGGQSAARYQRIVEDERVFFFKRIGEAMNEFVGLKNFKGVIVGGPGPTKESFLKLSPFNYQLKILGVLDIGYTNEYGLNELLEKSKDIISEQEAIKEKKLFEEFIKAVSTQGLVVYGYEKTISAIEGGKAHKLLLSEGLELKQFTAVCSNCGKTQSSLGEKFVESNCSCGGLMKLSSEKDLVQELIEKAEERGTLIEMISQDTPEGKQFHAMFHGVGAFLRYK